MAHASTMKRPSREHEQLLDESIPVDVGSLAYNYSMPIVCLARTLPALQNQEGCGTTGNSTSLPTIGQRVYNNSKI